MLRRLAAAAIVATALSPLGAHAQAVPDIQQSVTQGAQIEQAAAAANRPRGFGPRDDQAIDGEAGVYVLTQQPIFYTAANVGAGYSSNPLRTADDAGGSASLDASLGAGLRTRLGGAVDFDAGLSFSRTEYLEQFAPTNTVASGNVSLGTRIADTPLYVGATGFGGWNFDRHVKNGVSFGGVSLNALGTLPLNKAFLLQPSVVATRLWSGQSENNTKAVTGRLAAIYVRGRVQATLTAAAGRVWFDNFYEDVTFVPRRDWQYDIGTSVTYRTDANLLLGVSFGYVKRDSSFFLANYDSLEGGLTFSARLAF